MVMKRPWDWSPVLILGAFCTTFQARPVGTGLGAKFGRKPAKNQIQIQIVWSLGLGIAGVLLESSFSAAPGDGAGAIVLPGRRSGFRAGF